MFKHGIKPAWEDEINHKGGEWRFDLQYLSDPEALQKVWEVMIFDMVTGNAPYIEEGIAGVRLVQKSKQGALLNFRVEIWVTGGEESSDVNQAIKTYVDERLKGEFLKDSQAKDAPVKWSGHM